MNNYYLKGSEWRKWDLHIHTPCSVLSNDFPKDWDDYVRVLFTKALSNDIHGIGITDYYSIEGYKKIRDEYLENKTKLLELFCEVEIEKIKKIIVFPNIEFRIKKLVISGQPDLSWNKKVNFHLLLSDKIPVVEIENFLQSLSFETEVSSGRPQKETLTTRTNRVVLF